ncbi:unnamed protein product [Anisakis simplex]|uniref:Uncharacterized protein n=1 Tax=Anisakis simplex TaxID=6269 RepID=A0A0M3KHE1_ANISI|nr:unnamed protein product [Anisakis simplex]
MHGIRCTLRDKTKKIKDLLESNDEILKKLEAVRNSKAYEQMKYDTIARMNAHDVNTFLKEQFSKRQQHATKQNSNTEYESIVQKRHQAKLNEAACIIQRFFRSVAIKKRREKLRKAWTEVDPQRRVQLISDIADRIAVSRDAPQRVDLQTIKNKLKERKEGLDKAIADYEKCERMIKQMQQDLQLLASITSIEQLIKLDPRKLRCTKLALLLAERERERQLDQMQQDHDDILEEFTTSPPPPEGDLTSA